MSATIVDDPQSTFTLFAVFRLSSSHPVVLDGRDVPGAVQELEDVVQVVADEGVAVRGWYDVSGTRADADLMVQLHGETAEDLQWALRELRRTALLKPLIRVWGALGAARSLVDDQPKQWIAVAPPERPLQAPPTAEANEIDELVALIRDPRIADVFDAAGYENAVTIGRLVEPVEIVEVLQ